MDDLSSISAICVDTLNHELAVSACREMARHPFAEVVFVTDAAVQPHLHGLPVSVRVEWIEPLSGRGAYSQYVLKSVPALIDSPFALVFQWDGFILDESLWRPEFLEYDYVGGLFPPDMAERFGQWVGNGGFSLRSRRLMAAVDRLIDDCEGAPEDAVICAFLGERLRAECGMRFAPPELAMHFSAEHMSLPRNRKQRPDLVADATFGFHGFFNMHLAYTDQELLDLIDNRLGAFRTRLLTSAASAGLIANLVRADRKMCGVQVALRAASLLRLDPGRTSIDEVMAHCAGNHLP